MNFDDRWRELAARAREGDPPLGLASDLAQRARRRAPESIPFVGARAASMLAVLAVVSSAALLPRALQTDDVLVASTARIPPPPSLPSPPAVESPEHYVALARNAWRELTP